MVTNPVKKDEIMKRFIVRLQYGTPPTKFDDGTKESWPHATTALCIIVGTDDDKSQWVSHLVRRNGNEKHAEQLLIDYLKTNKIVQSLSLTSIEVYQNYSPCRVCANKILEYIEETKKQGEPFDLTIIFANFYKTHEYPGNDEKSAKDNIKGLQLLLKARVDLRLLGGYKKWKEFLNMNQFICLTEKEKNECLKKAVSDERKEREKKDRLFWDKKICKDDDDDGGDGGDGDEDDEDDEDDDDDDESLAKKLESTSLRD